MESSWVVVFVAISLMICPKDVICQNCGYRRFVLAEDGDYFPSENVTQVIPASDVSVCAGRCYRDRRCIAVGFDQSSQHCHMFSSYMTQTTSGTRLSGVKYLTLESTCGGDESTLSREHSRDGLIAASQVKCDETQTFVGTNDTSVCIYPSLTWTASGGDCLEKEYPFRTNGEYLHSINATLTIVGIPINYQFQVMLSDHNGDYALKFRVDLDVKIVNRNSRVGGVWQGAEEDLYIPFPFVGNTTFTMELKSSAADFMCTVNGQLLFIFTHRLPRDSITSIAIYDDVNLLKVLISQ